MYWSVIGLYAAFFAEIFTRIPIVFDMDTYNIRLFYILLVIATVLTGGIGSIYFRKLKEKWYQKYAS